MSARRWKRRRAPCHARAFDRERRREYHRPWWVRLLALAWPRVDRWHAARWQRIHEAAMKHAVKSVSHGRLSQEAPRG